MFGEDKYIHGHGKVLSGFHTDVIYQVKGVLGQRGEYSTQVQVAVSAGIAGSLRPKHNEACVGEGQFQLVYCLEDILIHPVPHQRDLA